MNERLAGLSFRWVIIGVSVVALVILTGLAALLVYSFSAERGLSAQANQTTRLLDQTGIVLEDVLDLETGLRGFLLTGQLEFLQPYLAANGRIDANIARLRTFAAGDPQLTDRINRIDQLIDEWQAEFAVPALRAAQAGENVTDFVRSGAGKRRIDAIRGEVGELRDTIESEQLLNARRVDNIRDQLTLLAVLAVAGSVVGAVLLAAFLFRSILTPIERLTAASRRIAGGQFAERVPESGGREIRRLALSFNEMSLAVLEREEELHAQNEELHAQQVQLEGANEQLEIQDQRLRESLADVQSREQTLQALNAFGRTLTGTLNRDELAERILRSLVEIGASAAGIIYVQTDEQRPLRPLAAIGLVDDVASLPDLVPGVGAAGRAWRERQPVGGPLPQSTIALNVFGRETAPDHELAVPLVAGDTARGVVVLARSGEPYSPTERDRYVRMAAQAAIAIGNALSHRSLADAHEIMQRQAAELQVANTVAESERAVAARERDTARVVIQSVQEAILLVDGQNQVVLANDRLSDLVHRPVAGLPGLPVDDLWDDLADTLELDRDGKSPLAPLTRPTDALATVHFRQQSPELREWQVYAVPILNGSNGGRLFVFRDITREAEIDRMKTEFVSHVSHELRTPLTSIKGYIDLLLDNEVGELNEEQVEFLQIVQNNSNRLVALISDLLDIARIEAGRIELQCAPRQIKSLIEQAASTLRMAIEEKAQTLTVNVPPDVPPVLADDNRMTQVLTNLLSNAHKYTPAGGRIEVRVEPDEREVTVRVSDTGIGLSAADLEQLFNKFFRAKTAVAQGIGGTGLGLAISKSIIEMHGGRIWVDSQPGRGTTFSFTVPRDLAGVPERPEEPALDGFRLPRALDLPLPDTRILVVDDDPEIAGLLRRYLERAGYSVVTTERGQEALELAAREAFDLITLDVLLPDIDGMTVLERLRASPATAHTPVLLVSVLPQERDGMVLRAVDYLTKPVDESVLLARIDQVLRDRQSRRVLVADDEPDIRHLFVTILKKAGYETLEAEDGHQAVDLALRHIPGAILLDVRMPNCDGVEALQQIRADETTRNIPVIMMTASPNAIAASREEVLRLGVSELLDKPTAPEDIVEFLRRELHPGVVSN